MIFRRCLLLVLMFTLPIQGALAASRLCMAMVDAQPAMAAMADCPYAQRDAQGAVAGDEAESVLPDASPGTHNPAPDTCKVCEACCLTATSGPVAPDPATPDANFAGHRPLAASVPHNVADGLERPPRTI